MKLETPWRHGTTHLVVYENRMIGSPHCGERTALAVGPQRSLPSLSEAADWWEPATADSTEVDYSGLYQQVGAKYYSVVVTPLENGLVRVHLLVHNT